MHAGVMDFDNSWTWKNGRDCGSALKGWALVHASGHVSLRHPLSHEKNTGTGVTLLLTRRISP